MYLLGLILTLVFISCQWPAQAAEVEMTEVKKLAELSVEDILQGTPIQRIAHSEYRKRIQESKKPVVVIFYTNHDRKSQNLATLIRYLSLDLHHKISFFAFKVSEKDPPGDELISRLKQTYDLERIPVTLFYETKGEKPGEAQNYLKGPIIKEYRTPSLLMWETYYKVVSQYMEASS